MYCFDLPKDIRPRCREHVRTSDLAFTAVSRHFTTSVMPTRSDAQNSRLAPKRAWPLDFAPSTWYTLTLGWAKLSNLRRRNAIFMPLWHNRHKPFPYQASLWAHSDGTRTNGLQLPRFSGCATSTWYSLAPATSETPLRRRRTPTLITPCHGRRVPGAQDDRKCRGSAKMTGARLPPPARIDAPSSTYSRTTQFSHPTPICPRRSRRFSARARRPVKHLGTDA